MDAPEKTQFEMRFPVFGVDVTKTGFDQREGTSPLGVNVRGFDGTGRLRGASRPGLTPWLGVGSTEQVAGFNPIQHLACLVTADIAATFNNTFSKVTMRLDYSETLDAPTLEIPEKWYDNTKPTFTGTSNVVASPPLGGGTGTGTCSLNVSTDGTLVTLVATFGIAGFPPPAGGYFFSGAGPVQTKTQANSTFFSGSQLAFAGTWLVVDFTHGYIARLSFNLFYSGP